MKLFVLTPDIAPSPESNSKHLKIENQTWSLQQYILEPSPDHANDRPANFTCVSYSWGTGRVPSPFHDSSFQVSDRTVPVLSAAVLQRPSGSRKFWVDAFCVPGPEYPFERAATLESMGFIYSRAEEVIAVLTSSSLPVLAHMTDSNRSKQPLGAEQLDIIEQEDWPIRAWTYQEAVNARRLRITCDGAPQGVMIDCLQFFSYIGQALNELSPDERKRRYPRLDAFEDVMADCAVAGFLERSALQVMAVMDGRTATFPDDHFYAMMGAISDKPASAGEKDYSEEGKPVMYSACEAFMRLCERKGDYSFIFSSVGRDRRPGYRWRPLISDGKKHQLPAIIKLHSKGEGLRGRVNKETGLVEVDDVVVLKVDEGSISLELEGFILRWLEGYYKPVPGEHGFISETRESNRGKLEQLAFTALQELGFTGSPECIHVGCGLFYPQVKIPDTSVEDAEILMASEIRWSLGCPGLIRYRMPMEPGPGLWYYVPGVFFGEIKKAGKMTQIVTLY